MRGPFERRCATPIGDDGSPCLAPVDGSISEKGHESMWCNSGHNIKEWYVVDSEGERMALARLNSSPQILNFEMMIKLALDQVFRILPPAPERPCKRGHNDWYMGVDSYRCRQCKNMIYEIHKKKAREKYRATPAYKANQLAKQARKKEKEKRKNVRRKD